MAKKYACSPFQSLGNCCLEKLEFLQQKDFTATTDIFIVLDGSGSFDSSRDTISTQIKDWYSSFRVDNPEYIGNVYFYSNPYDTLARQSHFYTVNWKAPLVGTKDGLSLVSMSRYRKVTPTAELPTYKPYTIQITISGTQYSYTFDNTTLQSDSWNVIIDGLLSVLNSDAIFVQDCYARAVNTELLLSVSGRSVYTAEDDLIISNEIDPALITALYADGLDRARYNNNNPDYNNLTVNEGWLSFPKLIDDYSSSFISMGFNKPEEVLFIYIGDESSISGAHYHGPNYIKSNVSGYDRYFVDKNNYYTDGYTLDQFLSIGMTVEDSTPNDNAIQSTLLSDPYNLVTLPIWGSTKVGGGYKEHYDEFVNTYYHKFKFFRGIVYGVSNNNSPYTYGDISTRNVFHSFIYQAIEPSTVSEEDFIESSFALSPTGVSTGLTLEFIKTRNYLAELGYGGLKNYGWKEYHNVGYGANVTNYFTPEIFQANIDRALLNGDKYILQGTLSNGIKLESNTLVVGSVKTTPTDINAGTLVDKIVAGDNIAVTVEDNKLVISSTAQDSVITKDLVVTVDIPNAGYSKGDPIDSGTDMTTVIETLLCPYTPPSFSAFTVNFNIASIVEIGRTVTVTNATYSTGVDSLGNPPSNISITGTGYNPLIIITSSPVATNSTPVTTVKNTASTEVWVISGEDAQSNSVTRSTNKTWQYMHRSGTSASSIIDSGTAQTVINSLTNNTLTSGKARTITCDATNNDVTKYTYICYDSSYGALSSIIQNGSLPVLTAFTRLPDYTYTNQYGVPRTMITYVSNSTGAFASGTTLLLS